MFKGYFPVSPRWRIGRTRVICRPCFGLSYRALLSRVASTNTRPAGTERPSSPWGDDVRILFARCRIGLRTAANPCGVGTDARAVLSRCLPKITYSTVFARACLSARRRYSRPSGLGCTPHRGDFHPDATPTLGLGRSILFNHRPSEATAKCSRPTVFRVATPTHRSLRPHYVPPQLSP